MINTSSIPAVAITLWILAVFSIATWALILIKAVQHTRLGRRNKIYTKQFWAAPNLQAAADLAANDSAVSRLAASGFSALQQPSSQPSSLANRTLSSEQDLEHSWDRHELFERNLRQQIQKERRSLEAGLAVLATVGSTAPFVGLFGTVWGIMNAMRRIGELGNASIDVVAGPIGEALIATGIGIAVAIPAVLSYNYFLRRLKSVTSDLEEFAHDFYNLTQRASFHVANPRPDGNAARELRHERSDHRARDLELVAAAGRAS